MCEECKNEVKEKRNEKKVRKVFLDDLPRWNEKDKGMGNKGTINWFESIGYKVKGIYDNIKFEVKIVGYDSKKHLLDIKYLDKEIFKIITGNFTKCKLGNLFKEMLYIPQYDENNSRRVDLRNLPLNSHGIDWNKVAKNRMKISFTYDNIEGEFQIIKYDSKKCLLFIQYLDKDIFTISTVNLKQCILGGLLGKKTNKFKIEIGQEFKDDKRNITITDRECRKNKNNQKQKWYKYHCNKCGWDEGWIIESNLLKGQGCSACCHTPRVAVLGINSIVDTDPWMIPYFQGGYDEAKLYTKSSSQKIFPICFNCGKVKNKAITINYIYKIHGIGCSCSDGQSYPFKIMFNVLEQIKIKFETEYNPDWIKPKRYDFYFAVDNNKYIVETDGLLGHGNTDNNMSGQTKEELQKIDDYKDKLAKEHGIEVIRIDCKVSDLEYIKNNILTSELANLFDFNNIDWNKAEEFALSNLVKKACEIKRDNPEMTTTEIGRIMKLNNTTICSYLKKGSKIWDWISYNPKEELRKSVCKNGKSKRKPVEIFKDNISLGIFESCTELERQSEKLFGVKLLNSNISQVCTNKKTLYKGFTFKYVD